MGMLVLPFKTAPVIPPGGVQFQDIVAPVVGDVTVTAVVGMPEQTVWSDAEN